MVEPNLLDCHNVVSEFISGLVNNSICAFSNLIDALISLDFISPRIVCIHNGYYILLSINIVSIPVVKYTLYFDCFLELLQVYN